jgi:hypothetical protein
VSLWVNRPKTCYKENEEKKYWAAKNNEIYERVKVKVLGDFGETQKRNRMGVKRHFVQEKSESKHVELKTKSNDVELASNPKHLISRL